MENTAHRDKIIEQEIGCESWCKQLQRLELSRTPRDWKLIKALTMACQPNNSEH